MSAPNQPRKNSFIRDLAKAAVLASCVAFFGGMGIMSALPADTSAATTTSAYPGEPVYYQELKNLGGGIYLCEVWMRSGPSTIIKLTASEKAKLWRRIDL